MKVQIYNWAGDREVDKRLETMGFKHGELREIADVFVLVKSLYDAGLNVMLPQPSKDMQLVVVDFKKLFNQR